MSPLRGASGWSCSTTAGPTSFNCPIFCLRPYWWREVISPHIWLVVEPTHLKNICQIGILPQIGVKIKHIWNHHLDVNLFSFIILKILNSWGAETAGECLSPLWKVDRKSSPVMRQNPGTHGVSGDNNALVLLCCRWKWGDPTRHGRNDNYIDMEGMVVTSTIYGSLRTNAPIMKGKLSAVAKVCRIRSYQGSRSQLAHSFKNVLEGGNSDQNNIFH